MILCEVASGFLSIWFVFGWVSLVVSLVFGWLGSLLVWPGYVLGSVWSVCLAGLFDGCFLFETIFDQGNKQKDQKNYR